MARFGNASASSLLRSASSSQNQINAYNDAIQSSNYDSSAKTQDDYNAYQTYLSKRIADTQNLDPTKALTLTNTLRSANRTYSSAEIGRVSTSIKYGDSSLNDKYAQLSRLRDAAIQNGDENLAQNLESQMASTSIAAQNEVNAAQSRAESASNKADAATNKAYMHAISTLKDGVNQLKAAKLSGQITPADYADRMRQLYLGNPTTNTPGIINLTTQAREATGDPNGTYQSNLDSLASNREVQGFVNGTSEAQGSAGNLFSQTIVKNNDGTYSFHQRPGSEVTGNVVLKDEQGNPLKDTAGHVITSQTYAGPQAFGDKQGNINGFQYATAIDPNTGQPKPGGGAQALRQIDASQLNHDDSSGVPYFYNEAGQKKFVGAVDENGKQVKPGTPGSHPIMANDASIITADTGNGALIGNSAYFTNPLSGQGLSNIGKFYTSGDGAKALGRSFDAAKMALTNPIGALNTLVRNNDIATAKAKAEQEAARQKAIIDSIHAATAYQASNAPALPANAHAAFVAAHYTPPAPITSGGNNIQKVLTQPVPKNPNGTVNAPAAATKLVTGLGYGNF